MHSSTVANLAIVCCVLAGCSRQQPAVNDVDLDAAASRAQGDIANYAAGGHLRRHGHPIGAGVDAPAR